MAELSLYQLRLRLDTELPAIKEDIIELKQDVLGLKTVSNPTAFLQSILTVDGIGSGLDADLFHGKTPSSFAEAHHTHTGDQITTNIYSAETLAGKSVSYFSPAEHKHKRVFFTNGIFTVPNNVTKVFITMCAAGGGGSSIFGCGGAAGESVVYYQVDVMPGEQITIFVGVGGHGGEPVNGLYDTNDYLLYLTASCGKNGGNTSFGKYKTCLGGSGALVNALYGEPGFNLGNHATMGSFPHLIKAEGNLTLKEGGRGGNSAIGMGGVGGRICSRPNSFASRLANEGVGFGSGGAGGGEEIDIDRNTYKATNGGKGADGICIIEWTEGIQ